MVRCGAGSRAGIVVLCGHVERRRPQCGPDAHDKTLAVQLGRHGITVNCIHPGITRTERTPNLLAARAAQLGVSPEEAERQDFVPDSPRGNAICRMVDASEVAFVATFLASEKAWAVSGELVVASGGAGRSVYY